MFVIINELYNYGQYYGDNPDGDPPLWVLNQYDYSIMPYKNVIEKLNLTSPFELYDYDYIPLFRTSAVENEKEFLSKLNNKKISKHFENIRENFDDEFRKYFHHDDDFYCAWSEYYDKQLISDAIEWCKKNKLSYRMY